MGALSGTRPAYGRAIDCSADYYPGRVLVRFKPLGEGGAAAQQDAHTAAGALQVLRTYSAASNLQLVEVAAAQEQAAINIYTAAANVEYAEPDYLTRSDSVPDDPDFGTKTWALHNIGQALP